MNAREFHVLANQLAGGASHAEYRSAISRAYYAAFHVAADALRALGFRISKGGAGHGEVAHYFANSANPDTVMAARGLFEVHTLRNRADYHLDRLDVESAVAAMNVVNHAQSLITAFDRILTSPLRSQIQSAIAAWRKSNGYP